MISTFSAFLLRVESTLFKYPNWFSLAVIAMTTRFLRTTGAAAAGDGNGDPVVGGGKAGARPNRACLVYANLARQAFPGLPVILGGIEASLRRTTHYDFWTDSLLAVISGTPSRSAFVMRFFPESGWPFII